MTRWKGPGREETGETRPLNGPVSSGKGADADGLYTDFAPLVDSWESIAKKWDNAPGLSGYDPHGVRVVLSDGTELEVPEEIGMLDFLAFEQWFLEQIEELDEDPDYWPDCMIYIDEKSVRTVSP